MTWSFLNPDTIDGAWSHVRFEGSRLVRTPRAGEAYALLCRHLPTGGAVHPLQPVRREYPQFVHGLMAMAADGHRHLLVVNDHPAEPRSVELACPQSGPHELRHIALTRGGRIERRAATQSGLLAATLDPLSLHVFTTE